MHVFLLKGIVFGIIGMLTLGSMFYWNKVSDMLKSTVGLDARKDETKNVAICIVGQAGRLEYDTKIKNLISINAARPDVNLFVIGVLDEGALYSDKQKHSQVATSPLCYENGTDMAGLFHDRFSLPNVTVELHMSSAINTFPLSKHSRTALDKYRRKEKTNDARLDRIQNHLRQFSHDAMCYQQIIQLEETHAMKMDITIRLRDNAMVLKPFDIIDIMEKHYYRKTLTKNCFAWGGVADKFWISPRRHLEGTMAHITEDVVGGERYLRKAQPRNSERLVKAVWQKNKVNIAALSPQDIPVTDGRCSEQGNMAMAPHFVSLDGVKDCAP